ncbi:MAG TPA: hypothetical protein VJN70_11675 [Gemmatimonadaceae bacterium]|nr:hypothetical protein [Gemmatimonadaceae bacterium]
MAQGPIRALVPGAQPVLDVDGCDSREGQMSIYWRSLLVAMAFAPTTTWAQQRVVIPAGTRLTVRLNEELSTANRRKGSVFSTRLEKPVTVDGRVVVPSGTLAYGRILDVERNKRVGRPKIDGTLTSLMLGGREVPIVTEVVGVEGKRGGGLVKVGAGTLIGAIAGAPVAGAAIGAGVAGVMRGSDLVIPAGTIGEVGLTQNVVLRR